MTMRSRCLSSGFALALASSSLFAQEGGPFGLHRGMTQEQVLQIVGKRAVKEVKDDRVTLLTVPKPHPAFEMYDLIFSPKEGLLKLVAIGRDIRTNAFGEAVRDAFVGIRDGITQGYGLPKNFDFLTPGSVWTEPQDWMMGLQREERRLASYWSKALPNHINNIWLEASALSTEMGYVRLGYEFDGFGEYLQFKKAQAATVFK